MGILLLGKIMDFTVFISVSIFILYFLFMAFMKGKIPTLRRLDAVDQIKEIIGRCVENGRPIWYMMDMVNLEVPYFLVSTVAALQTLAYTARHAARLGAEIFVPVNQGLAFSVTSDIVEESFIAEGKREYFVPNETVKYLAGGADRPYILNHMVSENIGGAIFLGMWYHKAILFTETAARQGAVTLGGTDDTANFAFMVAVCDYWVMGEEMYALGAYVSGDPRISASIAGQDIGKYLAIILMVVGSILATFGVDLASLLSF